MSIKENILEPSFIPGKYIRNRNSQERHAIALVRHRARKLSLMVHDLSLTLNVQKRNIKESPGNDSHILSFIISVFINFSHVLVGNIHHFLYLSSIYPCCQCLQRDLNGRHDSEWVCEV